MGIIAPIAITPLEFWNLIKNITAFFFFFKVFLFFD